MGYVASVSVTKGHRVVIPKPVKDSVSWLCSAEGGLDCTIRWMRDVPGLEIVPTREKAQSDTKVHDRQFMRAAASAWAVKLELYGQTFRFTVPEHVRRIGLLSGESGTLVMFGCRDVLELWRPEDWKKNLRLICGDEWK